MKTILSLLCIALILTGFSNRVFAQTIVITAGTSTSTTSITGSNPGICFSVTNANPYPVTLSAVDMYRSSSQNGTTFSLKYSATSLSGPVNITTWTVIATTVASAVSVTAIHPTFTGLNFTIPANTTYRLAVQNATSIVYGGATATPNSFTNGGITLGRGNYQIAGVGVGYGGNNGNLTSANSFYGALTFINAVANDIAAVSVTDPVSSSQLCAGTSIQVKAQVTNMGTAAQSNFPVTASYTGPFAGTLSTIYTGTLASGASATVTVGTITLQPGNYSIKAYTSLSTDTNNGNDTSSASIFAIKPVVSAPVVFSDTVCAGGNAALYVNAQPNTSYNWYSQPAGGSLLTTGVMVSFSPLVKDTIMYVAALFGGCESGTTPISAAIGQSPVVNLGSDTSFCETIPLILDAGNAGGTYLWSTGDTTQAIAVTNVSGSYWVVVDKYCVASDTVDVHIAPVPLVTGISLVRMDNIYHFTASSVQHAMSYLWVFGDGATSAGIAPPAPQLISAVHQYDNGIDAALEVMLIVYNTCGTDTAFRIVPTGINSVSGRNEISVFPNPASDKLYVTTTGIGKGDLQIMDLQGKLLISQSVNGNRAAIDIRILTAGPYVLKLRSSSGNYTRLIQVAK